MAIIVDRNSRVIIQGITGTTGRTFAQRMSEHYDTFVGGVTPGKGGEVVCGKPVFNFVRDAVAQVKANTSIIVVPSKFLKDAVYEAVDAGIKTIWTYTDGVAVHDAVDMIQYCKLNGVRLVGPNSAGVLSPGKASAAEHNENMLPLEEGNVGFLSKSGSLSYEVINMIHDAGFGFSSIICIGGDPVLGTTCADVLQMYKEDEETRAIVMVGEIGGTDEGDCAELIKSIGKPVIGYISGHTAPPKKKMGHAGAIAGGTSETAKGKTDILAGAGAVVVTSIDEIPQVLQQLKI